MKKYPEHCIFDREYVCNRGLRNDFEASCCCCSCSLTGTFVKSFGNDIAKARFGNDIAKARFSNDIAKASFGNDIAKASFENDIAKASEMTLLKLFNCIQ